MRLSGARAVCRSLVEERVSTIFGLPGGAIMPLYDVLPEFRQLHHVLVRHEQGAAHMADGYARAANGLRGTPTGPRTVGVCFGTSGPGATDLVTGIATAHMDSVPLVAIHLGMVRQQQQVQYRGNVVEVDLAQGGPDYVKLAQAYGISAWRVSKPGSELTEAIGAAMAYPGPALIECRVARTEDVYPWVLGGTSLGEVLPDTPYAAPEDGRPRSPGGLSTSKSLRMATDG
jgi:thiamine pyrophosphate-dependent acetolactate synthase large subunit-like protein